MPEPATWALLIAGFGVTFVVTGGGGSVTGASQTTNSDGVARVGSWTLGSSPGANTLAARAGSLPASPVDFTAVAVGLFRLSRAQSTRPRNSPSTTVKVMKNDSSGREAHEQV